MKMSSPELKVIRFSSEDVIATSLYYATSAAFNAAMGTNYTSNYVEFQGAMTAYDEAAGGWYVANPYVTKADSTLDEDIDGLKSGGSIYLPEIGITIPSTVMEPIARQAYNAYSYDNGLYTKGATYFEIYWQ